MNKTELRIGNIVSFKFWNPHPETPSYMYSDCVIRAIREIDALVSGTSDCVIKQRIKQPYENLHPVKINAYWLNKFGFTVENTVGGFERWTKGEFKLIDAKLAEMQNMKKIEFVHELQNLYFAVTGFESEVNSTLQANVTSQGEFLKF